jgi:putative ABC transport system substrate-binding protein
MASYIRQRKFLATLLGGAAAWPLVARAQQKAVPVIGYVRSESFDDTAQRMIAGFHKGLNEAGYTGRTECGN